MAYIPTEWQTGDIITAEKLNKAEEGIAANSPMIVEFTSSGIGPGSTISCNYALADILSALNSEKTIRFFSALTDRKEIFLSSYSVEEQYINLTTLPSITTEIIEVSYIRYDTTGISEDGVIFSKN